MRSAVVAIACAIATGIASAQSYPSKPVRIVLPFASGGGGDIATRVLTSALSENLGQPFVIDNRPGAGGSVAAEFVARSTPDGYTLLVATASSQVLRLFLAKTLPYDPIRDFTPIGIVGDSAGVVVAHPSLPVSTLKDLVDYARANPGKLSYGTSGIGTNHHLSMELVQQITGARLLHVPYKAGSVAVQDVVGGQIPLAFIVLGSVASHIKSGKLKPLAVDSEGRHRSYPDVMSVKEAVPGFESPPAWMALFGPGGLPQPMTARLNAEMSRALKQPATRAKFEATGFDPVDITPEDFAALLKRNIDLAGKIIKAAGIPPE